MKSEKVKKTFYIINKINKTQTPQHHCYVINYYSSQTENRQGNTPHPLTPYGLHGRLAQVDICPYHFKQNLHTPSCETTTSFPSQKDV